MTSFDPQFVQKIKSGDEFAYKRLFDEYYVPLCIFAKRFTNDLDASKDIVQDLFVKLYHDRDHLDVKTSLKSYLYQAVKNRCLNYVKHEQIHATHISNIQLKISRESHNWSEEILETELQARIYDIISKLPSQCQRIFKMSRLDGLKNQQIADDLNLSIRTVETQISKALKTLRTDLSHYLKSLIYILLWLNF